MRSTQRILIASAATAFAVAALGAAPVGSNGRPLPSGVVLEGSVETTSGAVIFPAGTDGRLQVRDCENCVRSTIQLDAGTEFILGGEHLSLREFAQYAQRNPGRNLTIHYRLADTVASRVTVLAP
jgi:hypothetical protein